MTSSHRTRKKTLEIKTVIKIPKERRKKVTARTQIATKTVKCMTLTKTQTREKLKKKKTGSSTYEEERSSCWIETQRKMIWKRQINGENGKRIYHKVGSVAAFEAAGSTSLDDRSNNFARDLDFSSVQKHQMTTEGLIQKGRENRGTRSRARHTNDIGKDCLMFSVSVGRTSYKSELELMSVSVTKMKEKLYGTEQLKPSI